MLMSDVQMTEEERRDAAKIEARRQREAERAQRFLHNPRTRQIGLDLNALDQQIKEKEEARQLAQNQAEEEAEQQRLLAKLLEQRDIEAKLNQGDVGAELRASWAEQSAMKKEQRERQKKTDSQQTKRSDMRFMGEDPLRGERKRMQAIQMRRWCMQQEADKRQSKEKEKREQDRYLANLEMINNVAGKVEREAQEERQRRARQIQQENQLMARTRREQSLRERKRALQGAGAAVTEQFMIGSGPGISAKDNFRGLSEESKLEFARENIRLIEEARQKKEQKAREKREEIQMMRAQNLYAERAQIEADEAAKLVRQQHLATLQQQKLENEQKRKTEQMRRRQGGIDQGYYSGFGKSTR